MKFADVYGKDVLTYYSARTCLKNFVSCILMSKMHHIKEETVEADKNARKFSVDAIRQITKRDIALSLYFIKFNSL